MGQVIIRENYMLSNEMDIVKRLSLDQKLIGLFLFFAKEADSKWLE